jgi:hypothetical protein
MYVEVLLDLQGLHRLHEGSFEVSRLQSQESLLQLELALAQDETDVSARVLREEGLQLFACVGQPQLHFLLNHDYYII